MDKMNSRPIITENISMITEMTPVKQGLQLVRVTITDNILNESEYQHFKRTSADAELIAISEHYYNAFFLLEELNKDVKGLSDGKFY